MTFDDDLLREATRRQREGTPFAGVIFAHPNPHLLSTPFIRREAVLSSQIEGTRASLSDLYAFEAVQEAIAEPVGQW